MKRQRTFKKQRACGFTLVEMLVYVSVLVIVSTAAVSFLIALSGQVAQQRAHALVDHAAQTAFERMTQDIRGADAVDTTYSTLTSTPGVLTLISGATTTKYTLQSGTLDVARNSGSAIPLTDGTVTVNSLRFFEYSNSNTDLVRVVISLSATVHNVTVTRTFTTSATLRGSYE